MSPAGPHGSGYHDPATTDEPQQLLRRQVPAWLLSLGLHATFFVSLLLVVPQIPRGAAEEAVRTGGIVLVSDSAGPPQYLSEEDAGGTLSEANGQNRKPAENASANAASAQAQQALERELSDLLPGAAASIAGSDGIGEATASAAAMTASGVPGPKLGDGHNYATTGVFGVTGRGTKFVYVFDRSGSMDGFQSRPLKAAKRELLASIAKLESVHQFQIVFYNERPTILNPDRSTRPRLMYGNETDKKLADDFVRGILADGGTKHLEALKLALGMQPHVIFFLTDADEPTLSNAELAEVRRLNERVGASINAIEFGAGPQRNAESFLVHIARQNSGAHVYVDVSQLPQK